METPWLPPDKHNWEIFGWYSYNDLRNKRSLPPDTVTERCSKPGAVCVFCASCQDRQGTKGEYKET